MERYVYVHRKMSLHSLCDKKYEFTQTNQFLTPCLKQQFEFESGWILIILFNQQFPLFFIIFTFQYIVKLVTYSVLFAFFTLSLIKGYAYI